MPIIKLGIRKNLFYPMMLIIIYFLREADLTILDKVIKIDIDKFKELKTLIMFLSEFISGSILYKFHLKFITKKVEQTKPTFRIKLIQTKAQFSSTTDGIYKIYFFIFIISFLDFIGFCITTFDIPEFNDFSPTLETRLQCLLALQSSLLCYFLLKILIYRHQKCSLIFIFMCLIIVIVSEYYFFLKNDDKTKIKHLTLLLLFIFIKDVFYSYIDLTEKYLLEYNFINPFQMLMFEGIFGFAMTLIFSFIKNPFKNIDIINNTSKIFSQIHKETHNNYSYYVSKTNNNSCNNKKLNNNNQKLRKNNKKSKTIQANNIKKSKTNMKINNLELIIQNNNSKIKSIKPKFFGINKYLHNIKTLDSFKTISNFRNTNRSNKIQKHANKEKINQKNINSERIKHNLIRINKNKTLNNINNTDKKNKAISKDKQKDKDKNNNKININNKYKNHKNISNNNKIKKINSKNILMQKSNILYNSIDVKKNKIKKFNISKNLNSKNNSIIINNYIDSKGKLRNLLLNNESIDINKNKLDKSMNNIKSISNIIKLKKEKAKNKTVNKIMNKTEANKEINSHNKIKSFNKNNNNKNLYKRNININ